MKTSLLLVYLGLLALLSSCSNELRLLLINNTGAEIQIVADSRVTQIGQGQHAIVAYPQEREAWILTIVVNEKERRYTLPTRLEGYPWTSGGSAGVHIQIEADSRLYLVLPSDITVVNIAERERLHIAGFPMASDEKGKP